MISPLSGVIFIPPLWVRSEEGPHKKSSDPYTRPFSTTGQEIPLGGLNLEFWCGKRSAPQSCYKGGVITSPQPRRMLEINVSRRPRLHQEVRRRGQELGTEKSPLVRGHKLCPGPEGPDLVCNLALQGSGSGALTTREGLANCRGEPREIGGALCVVCCQIIS